MDAEFVSKLEKEMLMVRDEKDSMLPAELWEKIKKTAKNFTIKHAKSKTSQSRLIESQLAEAIQNMESNQPLTKNDNRILVKTKQHLDEIFHQKSSCITFS